MLPHRSTGSQTLQLAGRHCALLAQLDVALGAEPVPLDELVALLETTLVRFPKLTVSAAPTKLHRLTSS